MGWIAHLATGEVVVEPEVEIRDELSPWQQLLARCRRENLRIVQLQLRKGAALITSVQNADGYTALYEIRRSMRKGKPVLLQGIGAIVGEMVFITWADDYAQVFQEVRQFDGIRVHATLQEGN